jgi:hypothetical protein
MSDYFACLDLINFKMSSALLALSPAGAAVAGAASGCGAGAVAVTGAAVTGAASVTGVAAGADAVGTATCGLPW